MKRILNTLYVTTPKTCLKKQGETIVAFLNRQKILQLPFIQISSIVCFGNIFVTPALLGACAKAGISITYLTSYGRFLARVQGGTQGNVLLRKEQYRISDDKFRSALIAKNIVVGKIFNARVTLGRALRDHAEKVDIQRLERAVQTLDILMTRAKNEKDLDVLRGLEGNASKEYFGVLDELIVTQKSDFFCKERNKRPPKDRFNALLSFLYTLLYHDMRAALEGVGLDPSVGFLHRDRPGRFSLALDLMEEFRSVVADRVALSLINLKQVTGKDFRILENGAVMMNEKARKEVLIFYQKRKQESIWHPFLEEQMHIGLLFHVQALLLARYLRGDIDGYPPFLWR